MSQDLDLNIFILVDNELADVEINDIILPYYQSYYTSKTNAIKCKEDYYNNMINSEEIYTWNILNTNYCFGICKDKKIYFLYNKNETKINFFKEKYKECFLSAVLESFMTSDLYNDAGCSCEDCIQIGIDTYCSKYDFKTITYNYLKELIEQLIND